MRCRVGNLNKEEGGQSACGRAKTPAPISARTDQIFTGEILLSTCAQSVIYMKIQDKQNSMLSIDSDFLIKGTINGTTRNSKDGRRSAIMPLASIGLFAGTDGARVLRKDGVSESVCSAVPSKAQKGTAAGRKSRTQGPRH